jgi:hypothetical protein
MSLSGGCTAQPGGAKPSKRMRRSVERVIVGSPFVSAMDRNQDLSK